MLRPAHLDASLIGQTLPWDLYTESGVLVAAAGLTLADEAQYLRLIARPLYRDVAFPVREQRIGIGVAERLTALAEEAETLLPPPYGVTFHDQVIRLARGLIELYRVDPEICLGYGRLAAVSRPVLHHALQVIYVSLLLADQLDFDDGELERLTAAALTMNIEMLDLYDRIHAQPGRLAEADREVIRLHPAAAAKTLSEIGIDDDDWLVAVAQHHECMDGSGYPEGLKAEAISMPARILHVADVYCAKLAGRNYRPQKTPSSAMQELFGIDRRRLDEQVATQLMRRLGLYPPGTLVRLENGECACVARHGRGGAVKRVVSFLDAADRLMEPPRPRDLETHAIRGFLLPDPAWPAVEWARLWEE